MIVGLIVALPSLSNNKFLSYFNIVYVEIETEGEEIDKGEVFGTVEAVKTVSDLFMPLSGEVVRPWQYHSFLLLFWRRLRLSVSLSDPSAL